MRTHFFETKTGMIITAVLCCVLWGSAFPVLKIGYQWFGIPSGDVWSKIIFAGLRFVLAGFIVLLLNALFCKDDHIKYYPQYKKQIFMLAFFGTVMQYFFFYLGLARTSGVKSSVYSTAGTFLVVLVTPLFFKEEKLTWQRILGTVVGLFGIFLTAINSSTEGMNLDFRIFAEGFLIIAGIGDAAATIVAKYMSNKVNPFHFSFYQMTVGGVILLALGLFFGIRENSIHLTFTLKSTLLLLYGAFISGAAFSLWNLLLRYHEAGEISAYKFLIPVFGSFLSLVFLPGENFTQYLFWGLVASTIGIYLVSYKPKKRTDVIFGPGDHNPNGVTVRENGILADEPQKVKQEAETLLTENTPQNHTVNAVNKNRVNGDKPIQESNTQASGGAHGSQEKSEGEKKHDS